MNRSAADLPSHEIRTLTPQDIPQVMALQRAYQRAYPSAAVIPGEVYLSSSFDDGQNVICAFDERGCLQGYTPVFPNLTLDPKHPHTVWAEVKILPELASPRRLKDTLFERAVNRIRDITRAFPGRGTRLTFQYHPTEAASIAFVMSKGCVHTESVFRMRCDLSREPALVPAPAGIDVRPWRMESEAEQRAYIEARNEAFPETPLALADWQHFLRSPVWQAGTTITAFDGQRVVGSVAVYWDEAGQPPTGKAVGNTEYIFVRAHWRRRGIAAHLIYQGLVYLREHGLEEAQLEVRASNRQALDLYQRLGYAVVDESQLFVLEL